MNVFTLCCAAIRATTLVFKEEPMVKKKIKFIAAATAMLMSVGGMSACGLSSSDNDKGQVTISTASRKSSINSRNWPMNTPRKQAYRLTYRLQPPTITNRR